MDDKDESMRRMAFARDTILRELMRALVEEGVLPPDRAARIVQAAASENFLEEGEIGPACKAARSYLLTVADAFRGLGRDFARRGGPPRHDPS